MTEMLPTDKNNKQGQKQKAKTVQCESACLSWTVWTALAWLGGSRAKPFSLLICRAILGFSFSGFSLNICNYLPTACTNFFFFPLLEQWLIAPCEGKYLSMCAGKLFPPRQIASSAVKSLVFIRGVSPGFASFLSSVRFKKHQSSHDKVFKSTLTTWGGLSNTKCMQSSVWVYSSYKASKEKLKWE